MREHPAILEAMYNHSTSKDLTIFAKDETADSEGGGFDWDSTEELREGHLFWSYILLRKNTETFYELYPEKRPTYPKQTIIMSRIKEIEELCKKNKLPLLRVFREAGVPYGTIQNWRRKEPEAFQSYDKIKQTIEKLAAQKKAS